jgi:hypothetical protein
VGKGGRREKAGSGQAGKRKQNFNHGWTRILNPKSDQPKSEGDFDANWHEFKLMPQATGPKRRASLGSIVARQAIGFNTTGYDLPGLGTIRRDLARLGWIGRRIRKRRQLVACRPGERRQRRKTTLLRPGRPHSEGGLAGFGAIHWLFCRGGGKGHSIAHCGQTP